jgi:hypothetical protein
MGRKRPAPPSRSARSLSTDARSGRDLCEPTVTCESHYFSLYKASAADPKPGEALGAMIQRFEACLKGLFDAVPPLPTSIEQAQAWCCQLKQNFIDFFADHPIHDCLALQNLSQFVCPVPSQNQTPQQYQTAVLVQIAPIVAEYIRSCFCSALLPPCPDPAVSNCVPLATITIRKRDCKIIRVCNWSVRKFVTTFPNLQYWLSFLPFVRTLRQLIEIGCCRPFNRLSNSSGLVSGAAQLVKRFTAFRRAATTINPEQEFSRVLLGAIANRNRAIDAQTLFLGAMEFQDDKQRPLMSDAELRNPLQYLLINQLAPSLVRNVVPDEDVEPLQTLWGNISRILGSSAAPTGDVQTLTSQVEELKRMVQDQQARISELQQRLGNR